MAYTAKVIADSVSPAGIRLLTMQLRYPKFIHGEFMTHRVFSHNASSSRAIPIERMLRDVIDDPAMPIYWGRNQKGMQAAEELTGNALSIAQIEWLGARDLAVMVARRLANFGLHKQIVNRLIEPWAHINVLVTATDYANFYALRRDAGAQPEIQAVANAMWEAQASSMPVKRDYGDWHLPYVNMDQDDDESDWHKIFQYTWARHKAGDFSEGAVDQLTDRFACQISTARCARLSYMTQDGKLSTIDEDLALYHRLVGSQPLHASPAEHQATPDQLSLQGAVSGCYFDWKHPEQHGNFRGWCQYRKTLPNECIRG